MYIYTYIHIYNSQFDWFCFAFATIDFSHVKDDPFNLLFQSPSFSICFLQV